MPQGKMDTLTYVIRDPNEAADELDRLRAALQAIANQDVECDLRGNYIVLMQIARAALEC